MRTGTMNDVVPTRSTGADQFGLPDSPDDVSSVSKVISSGLP